MPLLISLDVAGASSDADGITESLNDKRMESVLDLETDAKLQVLERALLNTNRRQGIRSSTEQLSRRSASLWLASSERPCLLSSRYARPRLSASALVSSTPLSAPSSKNTRSYYWQTARVA